MESAEIVNESRIGTLIGGKYNVLRLLGEGGMGSVYEAGNTWTDRRVAIKVLRRDMVTKRDVVARFMLEAKASTQINHPNIVEVLDMGEEPDGSLYIVQEFLDGTDLGRLLDQRQVLSPREMLDVAVPIMGALVATHRRGIIHRDIKPDNIFLVRSAGKVIPKLIDFGVSKVIDQGTDKRSTTQTGTAVGTPNYMSPEQARGDATVDGRCDVWAMGVVIYEMLAGRCPYDAPNYNLLIVKIIMELPPRIEEFVPDIPPALAEIIHRALEPDREKRYPSMRAFLSALLECPGIEDTGPALSVQYHESLGDMDAIGEITLLDVSAVESVPGTGDTPLANSVPTVPSRPLASVRPPPMLNGTAGPSIFRAPSLPPPPRVSHDLIDPSEDATQEIVQVNPDELRVRALHGFGPPSVASPSIAPPSDDDRVTTPANISPVTIEKIPSQYPPAQHSPPRWVLALSAVFLALFASIAGALIAGTSEPRPLPPAHTVTFALPPEPPRPPPTPVVVQPSLPVAPALALPDAGTLANTALRPTSAPRRPSVGSGVARTTAADAGAHRTSANGALILNP